MYRFLTGDLGLYVILSNPYQNYLIAESKKKTDKIDAKILADRLRGGYTYQNVMCQTRILLM